MRLKKHGLFIWKTIIAVQVIDGHGKAQNKIFLSLLFYNLGDLTMVNYVRDGLCVTLHCIIWIKPNLMCLLLIAI